MLVLVFSCFFFGCAPNGGVTERGMTLREKLLASKGCTFTAGITADFGENQYSFVMDCQTDSGGNLHFTVVSPENISGIQGRIDETSGKLTFDETVLAFPLLAQGEIAPATAPWLFWKSLLGGYIQACGEDKDGFRITIDDSFRGENLQLDVWLDENNTPLSAQILWQGRSILFLSISQFRTV